MTPVNMLYISFGVFVLFLTIMSLKDEVLQKVCGP